MMETIATTLRDELEDLGFKGRTLEDMEALVSTEGSLEELETFIANNEDRHSTILSIANGYKQYRTKQEPIGEALFIERYESCITTEDKQKCLGNLLKGYIDIRWVNDLDKRLHKEDVTLSYFHQAYVREPSLHIRKMIIEAVMVREESLGLNGW